MNWSLVGVIACFICFMNVSFSQEIVETNQDEIEWVSFADALEIQKENPQKIFLFIYTDWCEYCQETKETLFKDSDFISAVNQDYIPVRFNAENFEDVDFLGHTFGFQEESGYHELPIVLLQGQMSFPAFIFLTENQKMASSISGVIENIPGFIEYLQYISSDSYLDTNWNDYETPEN